MEWWILAGVIILAAAAVGIARLRRSGRTNARKEEKNIYPLW